MAGKLRTAGEGSLPREKHGKLPGGGKRLGLQAVAGCHVNGLGIRLRRTGRILRANWGGTNGMFSASAAGSSAPPSMLAGQSE